MLTLDRPQDANLKRRDVLRGMRVRMLPSGPEVDLQLGKTTVGSSPRCNIRIQLPGVQPLHCLILDQSNGLSVRRWAGETLLNGERLDEAKLQVGDCLQVGTARFEVVSQNYVPQCALSEENIVLAVETPTSQLWEAPLVSTTESNTEAIPAVNASLAAVEAATTARFVARFRARRLLESLRERKRLLAELHDRVIELERQVEQGEADQQLQAARLGEATAQLSEAVQRCSELEAVAASTADAHDEQLPLVIEELKTQLATSLADSQTLRYELSAIAGRESQLTDEIGRLEHVHAQLQTRATELTNQVALLSDEVDETFQLNQLLRHEAALSQDREAALSERISALEHECALHETRDVELANQISALYGERDELAAECDRLREATDRLPKVEQQLRDAIADRETTSSELYRALLQLAEIEDKAVHDKAVFKAQETVNAELERSAQEIAELQLQIEKLQVERLTAEQARRAHDEQSAELIEAHQRLAFDKTLLTQELAAIRAEWSAAAHEEKDVSSYAEKIARLEKQVTDLEASAAQSSEEVDQLQAELASKKQELFDAVAAVDEREATLAEHANLATKSAERLQTLEKELAESLVSCHELATQGDRSCQELELARHEVSSLAQRVTELEAQLISAKESTAAASADSQEKSIAGATSLLAQFLRSEQETAAGDSNTATSKQYDTAVSEEARNAAVTQPQEQGSYIDRYSRMFAEDAGSDAPQLKPQPTQPPKHAETSSSGVGSAHSSSSIYSSTTSSIISNNDEESIEDYMAKLLQRVRGESSPIQAETAGFQPESIGTSDPQLPGAFHPDPIKRRSSIPAPKTDLEALRALANESTRRAISRHSLRKHRRNATTKVIVCALAGATGALLMLDSPNWLSPQFVAACLTLLVAAYWGGETLRAWTESRRCSAKDETDVEIEELSRELAAPLPIDVE